MEFLYIIGAIIIFFALKYFAWDKPHDEINAQKREIDRMRTETENLKNEIKQLQVDVANGQVNSSRQSSTVADLRNEVANQFDKHNTFQQHYYKLLRAYMIARKKNQVDIVKEIEDSISVDYEALGNTPKMFCYYISSAMADFYTSRIQESQKELAWMRQVSRSHKIGDVRKEAQQLIQRAKMREYAMELLLQQIVHDYASVDVKEAAKRCGLPEDLTTFEKHQESISDEALNALKSTNQELRKRVAFLEGERQKLIQKIEEYYRFQDIRWSFLKDSIEGYRKELDSNLTAIPYMSKMIADIMTADIDMLAWSLSWGKNQERKRKVVSLNTLKKETKERIEQLKWAEYQLAYLIEMYPTLQDVIDTEFKEVKISFEQLSDYDPVSKYLDKSEWEQLTESQRNQLALDRYIASRRKSNWQIGRDYELYCGYCYEQSGYSVDYHGSYKGLEDLGRDLIVCKGQEIRIVQCKYWSQNKQIHENHVMQLYGSVIEYNIAHNANAQGILITNTTLSDMAKQFAEHLGISYKENMPIADFPRIKCNINYDGLGGKTYIYHLPMDLNYDVTKTENEGEFMALTVAEAESKGFRRAYKWRGLDGE